MRSSKINIESPHRSAFASKSFPSVIVGLCVALLVPRGGTSSFAQQMSALRGRICGDALLNKLIEFSQINRFDEMMLESGLAGLSDIFFHPKTR